MKRHSLDQWLHVKKRSTSVSGSTYLDWPARFRIVVGVAQGFSYLHHYCLPPIIHRDVKSSNIILDSAFNAKITDFGLARLVVKKGEETASVMGGSIGYLAPVFSNSQIERENDAYSFGVDLLELTTGKEAHLWDENTSLAEWACRHMTEDRPIVDALDKEIMGSSCLDEMIIVFKPGVKCTSNCLLIGLP
ncbi:receptor-like serine/threonine-protein kinase At1g78530 [Hevea brasiliensis]|uniref:receptor-like serine/threonine-protein kinase At1g78530 n=1 Tax=Hevea brasiliensis TaxID=3981 RepID=UPI0025DD1C43|nr:receptor-like serine/threonine-protein kinase At1g78530 [Hevea brasiliensis]